MHICIHTRWFHSFTHSLIRRFLSVGSWFTVLLSFDWYSVLHFAVILFYDSWFISVHTYTLVSVMHSLIHSPLCFVCGVIHIYVHTFIHTRAYTYIHTGFIHSLIHSPINLFCLWGCTPAPPGSLMYPTDCACRRCRSRIHSRHPRATAARASARRCPRRGSAWRQSPVRI